MTQRYLSAKGVQAKVQYSFGATEAKVPDIVDAIVELTETGSALRAAGLRIIDELLVSHTELMATASFFSPRSRFRISSSVRSGCFATKSSSHRSYALSGERLCPVPGFAATLPVLVHRSSQRTVVEGARLSTRAASRRLSPSSTIETARSRKSFEYPFPIASLRRCRRNTRI